MSEGHRVVSDGVMQRDELRGRRALVLGLGVSGLAVAKALSGIEAAVFASDARPETGDDPEVAALREAGVQVETGAHRKARKWLADVDLVIPSPGISPQSEILGAAIAEGVPVLSEIEIATRFVSVPVVAVTGTNGKTTTSRMIGAILEADGRRCVVCGNIGRPFISAAIESSAADAFVVEVSSFQLTFCYAFHPHVSVITNIAPDHLDWHGTMDAYRVAKGRIAARQTRADWFVYPADQPDLAELPPRPGPRRLPFSLNLLRSGEGVWVQDGRVRARVGSEVADDLGTIEHILARGRPFAEDWLAAAAAAMAFGVQPGAFAGVEEAFTPDQHRIQFVDKLGGVRFFDDSKATNPHATVAAMRGFEPVVLIAGGRNKGLDLSTLRGEARRLRGVVGVGESADDVVRAFEGSGVPSAKSSTIREAVRAAYDMAGDGDVVLLSPACSSYDQFEGYAHRGQAFQDAVRELIRERTGA